MASLKMQYRGGPYSVVEVANQVKHGHTALRSPTLTLVHFKQYRGHRGNVWVKYLHDLKDYMQCCLYDVGEICKDYSCITD
jgi:hypothetical protein